MDFNPRIIYFFYFHIKMMLIQIEFILLRNINCMKSFLVQNHGCYKMFSWLIKIKDANVQSMSAGGKCWRRSVS